MNSKNFKKILSIIFYLSLFVKADGQILRPAEDINNSIKLRIPYDATSFKELFANDVISYFELNEKYESDLQKIAFKKTEEFKILEDSLTKLKTHRWCIEIDFYDSDAWWSTPKYNIKTSTFDLFMRKSINNSPSPCPSKSRIFSRTEIVRFNEIQTTKYNPDKILVSKNPIFNKSEAEYLKLPITEEDGLSMEMDKENIRIYFLFDIEKYSIVSFEFADINLFSYDPKTFKFKKVTMPVVDTKNLRIVVRNFKTNKIYLDQLY